MEYIICRVCGYIETADKIDSVCPACGYPKTVWMEYKARKLSENRKALLDLHIHPIAVHFPITATAAVAGLPVLAFLVPFGLAERLYDMTTMITWILPLLVVLGAITGIVGGKLRYKTYTAPVLKLKIYLSVAYLLLSCGLAYIGFTTGVHAGNALLVIALGGVASVLAALLGKKGSYLFAGIHGPYVAG